MGHHQGAICEAHVIATGIRNERAVGSDQRVSGGAVEATSLSACRPVVASRPTTMVVHACTDAACQSNSSRKTSAPIATTVAGAQSGTCDASSAGRCGGGTMELELRRRMCGGGVAVSDCLLFVCCMVCSRGSSRVSWRNDSGTEGGEASDPPIRMRLAVRCCRLYLMSSRSCPRAYECALVCSLCLCCVVFCVPLRVVASWGCGRSPGGEWKRWASRSASGASPLLHSHPHLER